MEMRPSSRPAAVLSLVLAAALAGSLLAGPTPAAAEDELVAQIATGRRDFAAKCGACHGLDKPESKNMDRPAWDKLIATMESRGAKLTAEEREAILDYLGTRNVFLTRCTACHTTDRILERGRPFEEWQQTVGKMAEKDPTITEGEVRSIVAYLSALRGVPAAE